MKSWPQKIRSAAHYILIKAYAKERVLPPRDLCLKAFDLAPEDVRVVILGQDPYHTPGKAVGRAFAVPETWTDIGSSIANILEEVYMDTGLKPKQTLQEWTNQGVLLLNTRLTVETGQPMSHAGLGWELLVKETLKHLDSLPGPIVFLAWGKEAQKMCQIVKHHQVLETSHPCKFSAHRGFRGCRHFTQANKILVSRGRKPIIWGSEK